ncbi:hypothetical protein Vretimale_19328 [Volvox reticuliferus]|uniref:Major facilitator superfamily (MFS) profile domain-containing protein n=1 Tax=Volvox reticuliferus TaxID=1737510 RepID=A0A8J4D449_9CHLO|nr:hypothetical protein Vretifemale_20020 [Volvox reticuliferus]GIM16726.1 hypothetical protein Vretimale_19328 [Volvox reticuliferus]
MEGATLHQRLACRTAPRRCWSTSARQGIHMCVIVPSKDNASGSSGKRVPLWTFSDLGTSRGMLKHREALEEVFSREVEEPHPCTGMTATGSDLEHEGTQEHQKHQLTQEVNGVENQSSRTGHDELRVGQEIQEQEVAVEMLRERIASAALASTSEVGRLHQRPHHQANQRHHHYQQEQQQLLHTHQAHQRQQLWLGLNGTANAVNGASHAPQLLGQQHQQLRSQHQLEPSDLPFDPSPLSEHSSHSQKQQKHHIVTDSQPQQDQEPPVLGVMRSQAGSAFTPTALANGTAAPAAVIAGGAPAKMESNIPGSIWILCFISAALTCASCVFNTALPIYMVSELKMSMRSMGMFEGLLEAFSYVVRMCSGVVSDRMTSRKAAITLGFAAGAAAKFGMASAGSVGLLFAGKAVDRLANGIQAAPRDALIGDLSPPGVRSGCFGLAQSLRKWGSAVGALGAFFLMKASNNNYQLIFYSAATVSLTACLAFVVFVPAHTRAAPQPHEPVAVASSNGATAASTATASSSLAPSGQLLTGARDFVRSVVSMGSDFYRMLGVISLYALGHINESLLEARAMEVGFGKAEATLVVAAIAAVTFLTAYPLGLLDDRYGAGTTLAVGIGGLIAGDLVLLLSGPHPLALFAACLFLGVHWAVIQGPLLSIVSGLAPPNLRGTAFGIFYTVMAFTAVAANTMYGSIWHTYGANAAFVTSAVLMSVVLAALPYMLPASARRSVTGPSPSVGVPPPPPAHPLASLAAAGSPLPAAA